MKETYKVKVNDSHSFDLTQDDVTAIDSISSASNQHHVLHHNKSVTATVVNSDFNNKQYTVAINGTTYQVAINNQLDALIDQLGLSVGTTKIVNTIKAPMPGLILSVNVAVGQEIKEGDSLIIIEAMKMENNLTAPRDGVIKSIEVVASATVEKGALLIDLE